MERLQPYWEKVVHFWKEKHITKIFLLVLLVFVLLSMLFFAFMASTANVESLKEGLRQSTIIIDKNGEEATSVATNRTSGVLVNELPDHVKNAVIAIEDQRFYEHNGFDILGITRAFFKNLFAGRITGGGSTITQQLTKNALLSPEKTYKRKIEELFLAVEIEKHYKKDEILQMYLNQVYFGSGSWGIEQASSKYFNKEIHNVTINEAATLAGLLQAPSAYDPYTNYDRAVNRRNVVLAKMHELGMITEEELNRAKEEKLTLIEGKGSFIERNYPYYVDAVLDEAISKYGLTQEELLTRGYRIYTQLDQDIQSSLEKVYENKKNFPRGKKDAAVQSGAVLLEPTSGGVRGLVGGRGDYVFRGFNRATHIKAQPGSTMKPLVVYTPALENGYTVTSMLKDEQMTFGNYSPQNASRKYSGEVQMYEALEKSMNVPTVWLLDQIGLEKGVEALQRFGIKVEEEDKYLGLALGGMHKGLSPLKLAEAYSTFPNEGKRYESHLITKIVGPTGNVIAEHKPKTTRVTSKSVANEINSMLLNVVETGTGSGTKIKGVTLAGKTGSTQLPYNDIKGTKDQWFVGYTPNLVGAVWLGYDKTDREHYLPNSTSEGVVPLFHAIMEQSLQHVEPAEFTVLSVNDRLAGKEQKTVDRKQELIETVDKIEETLKEEAPKWKEKIDATLIKIIEHTKQIIEKIENEL